MIPHLLNLQKSHFGAVSFKRSSKLQQRRKIAINDSCTVSILTAITNTDFSFIFLM